MANDLTGDFDVVAEFTLLAADRMLAAMHSVGRLPHSWSLKVDDYQHLSHSPLTTGIRSFSDSAGQPITNPTAVVRAAARARALPPSSGGTNVDVPVNVPNSAGTIAREFPSPPEGGFGRTRAWSRPR